MRHRYLLYTHEFDNHLYILANLDPSSIENLPPEIDEGVYYGWAQFLTNNNTELYKLVASVGTNPFYHGKTKTLVSKKCIILILPFCLKSVSKNLGSSSNA